ncbi:MAG: M15 family metallopeptidase [Candidatus Binatia bacterium]
MPSRKISDLVPAMRGPATTLVQRCAAKGVEMRVSATLRDPFEQARLWRQSRAIEEIKARIKELKQAGGPFLAHCLESVGPQSGKKVTGAVPGFSWHQWGEAMDVFWVVNGAAEWSSSKKVNGVNGYQLYAAEAVKLGLDAGGLWNSLKDWPHVQLQKASSPAKLFSVVDIDRAMAKKFGP